jgi:undecaprenyl-diphosphatase
LVHGTVGRLINRRHLDRGERYLAERGGKAVFLGRFTAALRVMMPGLAGMARMRYRTFLAYNVAGGAAWGALCVLLGYLGGSSWRRVEHLASRVGLAALAAIVVLIAAGVILKRLHWGWAVRLLERLGRSRPVVWFGRRYPRTAAWLALRFDARRPNGLPLTLLVAVAVSSTWVTLGLTQDVLAHEGIVVFDLQAHAWVLRHRIGWLTATLRAVTWLGSNAVILPVLAVSCVLLSRLRRSWRPALDIVVVYVWTVILYSVIKDALQRPRPPLADWLAGAGGWSFPSGHSAQATAAWGILCVLACVGRPPRQKVRLVAGAAAIIVLVAGSRWYLGVHWLTDVLAGMTLGVAVLSLWGVARTTIITTDPDTDSDTDNTEDGTDQHPGQAVPDSALPATGGSGDRPGRG